MQNDNLDVTAVMITRNLERRRYVMMSIRSFLKQTYGAARLLIVNDGNPVEFEHPRIRELLLPFEAERTLGDLRNIALDHVETPLVIQWDDDDWSRPDRIALQVDAYAAGHAVLLKNQLRYDTQTGECRLVTFRQGIDGTILHPVGEYRYPSWRRSEDSAFLDLWKKSKKVLAIDNDPGVYIRLYTGHNTWDRHHVMSPGEKTTRPEELFVVHKDLAE